MMGNWGKTESNCLPSTTEKIIANILVFFLPIFYICPIVKAVFLLEICHLDLMSLPATMKVTGKSF